jgi:hypothetical protein
LGRQFAEYTIDAQKLRRHPSDGPAQASRRREAGGMVHDSGKPEVGQACMHFTIQKDVWLS